MEQLNRPLRPGDQLVDPSSFVIQILGNRLLLSQWWEGKLEIDRMTNIELSLCRAVVDDPYLVLSAF